MRPASIFFNIQLSNSRVIMYTGYIYQMTQSISLVTIVILLAGLAPVLHMAWTYLKIKFDEYQDIRYIHYMKR